MGYVWSRLKASVQELHILARLAYRPLFNFKFFNKSYNRVKISSYKNYERVIRDEINKANEEGELKRQARQKEATDLLPDCDLTVWLRDYKDEVVEPLNGIAFGTIPDWLSGSLVRNGPGTLTVGQYAFNHLFDASAVLHRFHIKNGSATYQSRNLRTKTFEKNHAANRIVISEFGTKRVPDPCKTIFQKFSSHFMMEEESDNCLISVYPFRDEVYALTEIPVMHKIDINSLESLGSVNLTEYINIVHHTSHPHVDEDGLVYNVGLSLHSTGPMYSVVQFPNSRKQEQQNKKSIFSEARIVAKVKCRWPFHPGYMHTFGVTENFYVLVEQPMCVSVPAKLASNFNNKPLSKILQWHENFPTLIYVLSKNTGKCVATFLAEPFFYLHLINQYEDNNHVVIDICAYKDPSMINCMLIESLKTAKQNPDYSKMFRGRPVRYVLPMDNTKIFKKNLVTLKNTKAKAYRTEDNKIFVIPEILCDMGCETPRINYPNFLGKKYQYFYSISADVDIKNPGTLIKVDVINKTKQTWTEVGTFPSEPIFIPSPNSKAEDDGVILSTLLWSKDDSKVAVVVLDAHNFVELGRTIFMAPGPVPKCLHGWYFPESWKTQSVV